MFRLLLRPVAKARARYHSTVAGAGAAASVAAAETVAVGEGTLTFARTQPFKFNIIVATVKTALCDLLVQRYIEKRDTIDWKRNGVFVMFGGAYLGVFQYGLYVGLFQRLWPGMATFAAQPLSQKLRNAAGLRDLCKQIAFDNFVHYPFIYFPTFYCIKEGLQGDSGPVVAGGLAKYRANGVEDNLKMWALWIPGDAIVYAVPLWMRLPLNHGLSFVWTCYLSFLRGGQDEADEIVPLVHAQECRA